MSSAPVAPVVPQAPATAAPAKPLTALQVLEQELAGFIRQREEAISRVHAVEGAIQAAQHLLSRLKAEEQKAVAFAAAELAKAETAVAPIVADVEAEAKKVVTAVESAL